MSKDLTIETNENEDLAPDDGFEEQLCSDIANLSAAFSSLGEIDGELLSNKRKAKLARMKRILFDTLAYYVECLPQTKEEEE